MRYTIYKITNTINGKIYIGKHQTNNLNDGYYGSGRALKNAIRKYGRENFTKEILYVFNSGVEMDAKEKELVTEEFVLRDDTYNLGVGGEGGPHFKGKTHSAEAIRKRTDSRSGYKHSADTRQKISEANLHRIVSEDTKRKISETAKKRVSPDSTKHKQKSTVKYVMTEEHKMNIAVSVKNAGVINDNVFKTIVCPHCNKEGQKLAMLRHHFDNCKFIKLE